eukprot:gene46343-biopygen74923
MLRKVDGTPVTTPEAAIDAMCVVASVRLHFDHHDGYFDALMGMVTAPGRRGNRAAPLGKFNGGGSCVPKMGARAVSEWRRKVDSKANSHFKTSRIHFLAASRGLLSPLHRPGGGRCRNGHDLTPFRTHDAEYYCSECNAPQPAAVTMYGCRPCDYDLQHNPFICCRTAEAAPMLRSPGSQSIPAGLVRSPDGSLRSLRSVPSEQSRAARRAPPDAKKVMEMQLKQAKTGKIWT